MDNATAAASIQSYLDDIDNLLQSYNTEAGGNDDSGPTNHQLQPSFDSERSGTHFEIDSDFGHLEQSTLQPIVNENATWGSLMPPTRPTTVEKSQPEPHLTTSFPTAGDIPPAASTCTGCADDGPPKEMIHTKCGHSYCFGCTKQYVQVSLRPDSTFPPSCCDLPLTLAMIKDHVTLDVIRQYIAKQDEIANACSLRCAQPSCKTMIPQDKIENSKGICPTCHKHTCRNCKLVWHESKVCRQGKVREEIVKLAKKKGWRFCFMCRSCIGISYGCNHITSVHWSKKSCDARLMVVDVFAKHNFAMSAA